MLKERYGNGALSSPQESRKSTRDTKISIRRNNLPQAPLKDAQRKGSITRNSHDSPINERRLSETQELTNHILSSILQVEGRKTNSTYQKHHVEGDTHAVQNRLSDNEYNAFTAHNRISQQRKKSIGEVENYFDDEQEKKRLTEEILTLSQREKDLIRQLDEATEQITLLTNKVTRRDEALTTLRRHSHIELLRVKHGEIEALDTIRNETKLLDVKLIELQEDLLKANQLIEQLHLENDKLKQRVRNEFEKYRETIRNQQKEQYLLTDHIHRLEVDKKNTMSILSTKENQLSTTHKELQSLQNEFLQAQQKLEHFKNYEDISQKYLIAKTTVSERDQTIRQLIEKHSLLKASTRTDEEFDDLTRRHAELVLSLDKLLATGALKHEDIAAPPLETRMQSRLPQNSHSSRHKLSTSNLSIGRTLSETRETSSKRLGNRQKSSKLNESDGDGEDLTGKRDTSGSHPNSPRGKQFSGNLRRPASARSIVTATGTAIAQSRLHRGSTEALEAAGVGAREGTAGTPQDTAGPESADEVVTDVEAWWVRDAAEIAAKEERIRRIMTRRLEQFQEEQKRDEEAGLSSKPTVEHCELKISELEGKLRSQVDVIGKFKEEISQLKVQNMTLKTKEEALLAHKQQLEKALESRSRRFGREFGAAEEDDDEEEFEEVIEFDPDIHMDKSSRKFLKSKSSKSSKQRRVSIVYDQSFGSGSINKRTSTTSASTDGGGRVDFQRDDHISEPMGGGVKYCLSNLDKTFEYVRTTAVMEKFLYSQGTQTRPLTLDRGTQYEPVHAISREAQTDITDTTLLLERDDKYLSKIVKRFSNLIKKEVPYKDFTPTYSSDQILNPSESMKRIPSGLIPAPDKVPKPDESHRRLKRALGFVLEAIKLRNKLVSDADGRALWNGSSGKAFLTCLDYVLQTCNHFLSYNLNEPDIEYPDLLPSLKKSESQSDKLDKYPKFEKLESVRFDLKIETRQPQQQQHQQGVQIPLINDPNKKIKSPSESPRRSPNRVRDSTKQNPLTAQDTPVSTTTSLKIPIYDFTAAVVSGETTRELFDLKEYVDSIPKRGALPSHALKISPRRLPRRTSDGQNNSGRMNITTSPLEIIPIRRLPEPTPTNTNTRVEGGGIENRLDFGMNFLAAAEESHIARSKDSRDDHSSVYIPPDSVSLQANFGSVGDSVIPLHSLGHIDIRPIEETVMSHEMATESENIQDVGVISTINRLNGENIMVTGKKSRITSGNFGASETVITSSERLSEAQGREERHEFLAEYQTDLDAEEGGPFNLLTTKTADWFPSQSKAADIPTSSYAKEMSRYRLDVQNVSPRLPTNQTANETVQTRRNNRASSPTRNYQDTRNRVNTQLQQGPNLQVDGIPPPVIPSGQTIQSMEYNFTFENSNILISETPISKTVTTSNDMNHHALRRPLSASIRNLSAQSQPPLSAAPSVNKRPKSATANTINRLGINSAKKSVKANLAQEAAIIHSRF